MIIQNNVPLMAIILESFIGSFMLFLSIRGIVRYFQKKSRISYYLTFALFSFSFAAIISAIGKYIDFSREIDDPTISYTDFTIVLAYCLLGLGNIFYTVILKDLYLDDEDLRPLLLIIVNGIIIGLNLSKLSTDEGVYDAILPYLILFILTSFAIHGIFLKHSISEARNQDNRVAKTGFLMIGGFSLSFILVILLFIMDLVGGIIRGYGYTTFYYLGWSFVGLSTLFGFLGFIMPQWFRNLVSS